MRAVIYHLVINFGAFIIGGAHRVLKIFALFVYNVAAWVSKEQDAYCKALTEQAADLDEVKCMTLMLNLQEKAKEEQDWDDESFAQLNFLAGKLINVHGWDQAAIDAYLTCLVNTGPEGYAYQPNEDSDFDDDDEE
jgi:hypothetical protein